MPITFIHYDICPLLFIVIHIYVNDDSVLVSLSLIVMYTLLANHLYP
jgi:hypothetical protein